MYITEKAVNLLKVEKPEKIYNMIKAIRDYCGDIMRETEGGLSHAYYKKAERREKLNPETYAARVEIIESGNEPRLYATVRDNNGEAIYTGDILEATPEAYAKVAKGAGAFLEAFNIYMSLNF